MTRGFDGKIAAITGGARGIGAATARMLADKGCHVAFSYAQADAAAQALVSEIEAVGVRALAVKADMGTEAGMSAFFAAVDETFGALDFVVNNAGITGRITTVAELETEDLRRVIDINVFGAMLCCREAVRRMSTKHGGRGGAIVNLSSAAVRIGSPNEFVHYAMSKGAIDSLTLGLAREVGTEGIRVNAVAPGLIETDIHASAGAPDRLERLGPGVPIGRAGTAEETAAAIVWLLGPESSYVTGGVVPVTGGR